MGKNLNQYRYEGPGVFFYQGADGERAAVYKGGTFKSENDYRGERHIEFLGEEFPVMDAITGEALPDVDSLSVREISLLIADIHDPEVLSRLMEGEKAGKNRASALQVLADRLRQTEGQ